MKNLRFLTLTLLLLTCLGLASCGQNKAAAKSGSHAESASLSPEETADDSLTSSSRQTDVPSEEPDGPLSVTDLVGRTVQLPASTDRIAAINSAARMLTYAGAADRIVGVTDLDKEGQPGMPYAYVNKDHFQSLASTGSGGSGDTTYTEELVTLDPDLIFAFTSDRESLDQLQDQTGIPVIGLYATDMFAQDFKDSLRLIGSVMGTKDRAEKVVAALEGWQADLDSRTADIADEDKPSVYMGAMGFRGPHGFEGTCAQYPPFTAIHAKNVVDETGERGALLIDLEKVTIWDPDIIFINPSSLHLVNENYQKNPAFYDQLRAVRENRLYSQVSYNYNATNMEIAIADAYYAGTIIYPEAFSDLDFSEKAEEIFQTMLGSGYLPVLDEAGIGFGSLKIGD